MQKDVVFVEPTDVYLSVTDQLKTVVAVSHLSTIPHTLLTLTLGLLSVPNFDDSNSQVYYITMACQSEMREDKGHGG